MPTSGLRNHLTSHSHFFPVLKWCALYKRDGAPPACFPYCNHGCGELVSPCYKLPLIKTRRTCQLPLTKRDTMDLTSN